MAAATNDTKSVHPKIAKSSANGSGSGSGGVASSATIYPFNAQLSSLQMELVRPESTDGKFTHSKLKRSGVHVVFVLDKSGSMGNEFPDCVIPLVNGKQKASGEQTNEQINKTEMRLTDSCFVYRTSNRGVRAIGTE